MAPPKKSTKVQTAVTRSTIVKPRATGENMKQKIKTYYIDEEGQYFLKSSSGSDEVLELDESFADDEVLEAVFPGDIDGETITLVESQNDNSDVNYFMVMQEKDLAGQSDEIHIANIDEAATDAVTMHPLEENERRPENDVDYSEEDGESWNNRTEAVVTEFKCELCSYSTQRKYLLQRHMSSHSNIRPFTCKVCERRFKTAIALSNHVNTHRGVKPHNCTTCVSSFTTSGELLRHIRYKHSNDKPHKCTECDYASVEMSKLRRHMLCHTGERPYQCTHCTYASQDNFKLKRHMRTHTGEKPYKCTDCPMSFTQSNSLKVHMLIHNFKDKPVYACELCPVTCGRMPDLRIHMQKQHTSAEPIKCKKCSKTFPDKHTYKLHSKTHDGEMLKCTFCTYESSDIRSLNSHVLKHANQKPFACDKCDQTFRQKQLLRRHENINHNPAYVPKKPKAKAHVCPKCNRSYAHMGNYLRHKASHDILGDGNAESQPKRQYRSETAASDSEATEDFDSYNDQADSDDENLMKLSKDLKTKHKNGSKQADDGGQTALENKGKNKKATATVTSATIKKKALINCFGFDEGDEREENGDDTRLCATK